MKIPVAILAGGKSRRMGRDKALIEIDGVSIIERVIDAVGAHASEIVIIANEPDKYQLGYKVYRDKIEGMGPLSGLYTAFEVITGDTLMLVACDMPYIMPDMVEFIISCQDREGEAVIPMVGGREQGLLAIYKRACLDRFKERIESKSIQFDEFKRSIKKSFINEEELLVLDKTLSSFHNVNRPVDLP